MIQNKNREAGFYWTRFIGVNEWQVCEFVVRGHGNWWISSDTRHNHSDADFQEIDEKRLQQKAEPITIEQAKEILKEAGYFGLNALWHVDDINDKCIELGYDLTKEQQKEIAERLMDDSSVDWELVESAIHEYCEENEIEQN